MKPLLIAIHILVLITIQLRAQHSIEQQPDYYLNGVLVSVDQISLIFPKNIRKIEIIKNSAPPQIRINTKKIVFLTYLDIKTRAGAEASKNAVVMMDNKIYSNDLFMDKQLIKTLQLKKGDVDTIFIKTKFYKRKVKDAKNPPIRIRGQQLTTTRD